MATLLKPPMPPKSFDPDDKGWAELRAWTDAMTEVMVGQLQRINAMLDQMIHLNTTSDSHVGECECELDRAME